MMAGRRSANEGQPPPAGDSSAESTIAQRLERLLGKERAVSEPKRLASFQLDGVTPAVAAFPGQPEQVAEVLALAASERWGVIPWGGGHSISAGNPPGGYRVALSLSRMESALDHDRDNLTLSAEGGMTLADANRLVAGAHQLLPLGFPGERNTLGGIVAAARPAPKRLLYGDVRDLLIAVRVALPDGGLVRYGRKVIKNVAGYDMNKLFLGSQGMLGVIVEATFKLFALPDEERFVAASFAEAAAAGAAAAALLASQLTPACLFLLEPAAAATLRARERLPEATGPFLLLSGFEGRSVALARQVGDTYQLMLAHGATAAEPVAQLSAGAGPFLRRAEPPAQGGPETVRLRIGATQSGLAEQLAGLAATLETIGLRGSAVADYSGASISLTLDWPGEAAATPLAEWIAARRAELESVRGSVVVEAAPVALKRRCHVWGELGGELEIMRLIKARFDPAGIMAPGRYLEGM